MTTFLRNALCSECTISQMLDLYLVINTNEKVTDPVHGSNTGPFVRLLDGNQSVCIIDTAATFGDNVARHCW